MATKESRGSGDATSYDPGLQQGRLDQDDNDSAGNLQQVTDAGAVTTNPLTIPSVTLTDPGNAFKAAGTFSINRTDTAAPNSTVKLLNGVPGTPHAEVLWGTKLKLTGVDQAGNEVDIFAVITEDDGITKTLKVLNDSGAGVIQLGDGNHLVQVLGRFSPPDQIQSSQASSIFQGAGVPNNANGLDGDYFLRNDSPGGATHLYFKTGGAWVAVV